MAGTASDYNRGEMDIHEQASTFQKVMGMTKWASLAVAAGVLFLVLWFCTGAGFGAAFISAVILVAIGIFALRQKADPAH